MPFLRRLDPSAQPLYDPRQTVSNEPGLNKTRYGCPRITQGIKDYKLHIGCDGDDPVIPLVFFPVSPHLLPAEIVRRLHCSLVYDPGGFFEKQDTEAQPQFFPSLVRQQCMVGLDKHTGVYVRHKSGRSAAIRDGVPQLVGRTAHDAERRQMHPCFPGRDRPLLREDISRSKLLIRLFPDAFSF